MQSWILHVDMDAFFASIEQRDNPTLNGKPVIVGGDPHKRGVVSAASYEARKFGVHSAMPLTQAYRLCPHGIYLPVRMSRYENASKEMMKILKEYSPLLESISLDEAFVDLTGTEKLFGPPDKTARTIQNRIKKELDLTASIGLASTKFMAKIASDLQKPNGFVVLNKEDELATLYQLPISVVWGIGEKTEKELSKLGIKTVQDLANYPKNKLEKIFGKIGDKIQSLSQGWDDRPVIPFLLPKSCGNECTFEEDQFDLDIVKSMLLSLSEKVGYRLRNQGLSGKTITIKVRLKDFSTYSHSRSIIEATNQGGLIYQIAEDLLKNVDLKKQPIRLIGVSLSNLSMGESQLSLFIDNQVKTEQLYKAIDRLNEKYKTSLITRASISEWIHKFPGTIYKE